MTNVTVTRNDGLITSLGAKGHAAYAKPGREDIVCAGISVLMTTCANSLETVSGITPVIESDPKNALIRVSLPETIGKVQFMEAQIIMRTILQGLKDISDQYPKNLRISDDGGKENDEA